MNTGQLERIFMKIGGEFQGVFTNNNFRLENRGYYVVNTVSDPKVMGHWVLFFIDEGNQVNFIDSFAKHPSTYGGNIFKICNKFNAKYVVKNQLQSNDSLLCGLYCVYFIFYLNKKFKMERILSHFSCNYKKNDRMVERILSKLGLEKCELKFCPMMMYNRGCLRVCTCLYTCNK